MKVATKFVSALTCAETMALTQEMDTTASRRVRMRAHTILLSSQGLSINQIAQIYQVHRNSVSSWIDKWLTHGLDGLYDRPRSGSPPKLTPKEQDLAQDLIRAHPNAPRKVLGLLCEKTGKTISRSSLRRLAKKADMRWKRVRKSVKSKRNEVAFTAAQQELETLKKTSD